MLLLQYPNSSKFYLAKFYGAPIRTVSRMIDATLNEQDVSQPNSKELYSRKIGSINDFDR